MAGKAGHRGFGAIRKLPSGKWQASYVGPDTLRHTAPSTFDAKIDAEAWVIAERRLIEIDAWTAPKVRRDKAAPMPFGEYATTWLAARTLKPRTRAHYSGLLKRHIRPTFDAAPVTMIRPETVRAWYAGLNADTPTNRAHAYSLLRAILATAVDDELLRANPAHIRGAGSAKRRHTPKPATLPELEKLVAAMPARLRLMVLLASWTALRFGELAELRRSDIDVKAGTLRVSRGVARADGEVIVGTPKSTAGLRDVAIPPHVLPAVKQHLREHCAPGRDALLFPAKGGGNMAPSTLYKSYYPARKAAGRADLRFHDLRHTGAVLAASTGATLAELMGRLGHSSPQAALRYQHAARGRDAIIAELLSELVTGPRAANGGTPAHEANAETGS